MGKGTVSLMLAVDASKATREVSMLAGGLRDASGAADDMSSAAGNLTASTKGTSGSMINLVRNLNDVAVMASMGANPLQILATQGEQIAFAFKESGLATAAFASSVGSALPILAAVGASIYALVSIIDDYTNAKDEATRAEKAFQAALAPMKQSIADARKEQELLNKAFASGDGKNYLAIARISADADAKAAEATKALREEKDALMQTLATMSNMDSFDGQRAQARIKTIDKEIAAVNKQADEYAALAVTNYTYQKAIDESGKKVSSHTAAVKADTSAVKAQRAEEEAWAALQKELQREIAATRAERAATMAGIEAYWSQSVKLADVSNTMIKNAEDEAIALADLALAYSQAQISAEDYAKAKAAVQTAGTNAAVSNAATTVSQYSSANGILNTVSNAGPWGALIAGIIDAVKNLEETVKGIQDLIGGVLDAVGKLPEIIMQVMQYAQKDLPEAIGKAIGSLIAGLPDMLASAIGDILNPMTLLRVFARFFDAILKELGISGDMLKALNDGLSDIANWFKQAWIDIKRFFGVDTTSKKGSKTDAQSLQAQSDSRQNSLYAGTSRTTSGGYGFRPSTWAGTTVMRGAAAMGGNGASVRMGGRNGKVTLEIDESTYADVHKGLRKRGVIA